MDNFKILLIPVIAFVAFIAGFPVLLGVLIIVGFITKTGDLADIALWTTPVIIYVSIAISLWSSKSVFLKICGFTFISFNSAGFIYFWNIVKYM